MHRYIKAQNKEKLARRLDRIEGQVRGVKRMVERAAYCIDIVNQITSLVAASEKVASTSTEDHVEHCVRGAMRNEDKADEKMGGLTAAIERFLRV